MVNAAHRLGVETWEQCFLEFDAAQDRQTMYNVLSVCKTFHKAMSGSALLEEIDITSLKQVPQLVSYLIRRPAGIKLVKALKYKLHRKEEFMAPEHKVLHNLVPAVFLLEMLSSLRRLDDIPVSTETYDATLRALRDLPHLRKLSLHNFQVRYNLSRALFRALDLEDVHDLAQTKLESLYLEQYHAIPAAL